MTFFQPPSSPMVPHPYQPVYEQPSSHHYQVSSAFQGSNHFSLWCYLTSTASYLTASFLSASLSLQCVPNQYQWNTPQVGKMQLAFSLSSGAFGQFWPVLDVCSLVADAVLCSLVPPAVTICLPACWWSFCSATCVVHGGLHSGGADSSRKTKMLHIYLTVSIPLSIFYFVFVTWR